MTVTGAPLDAGAGSREGLQDRAPELHARRRSGRSEEVKQNTRLVVVLKITEAQPQFGRVIARRLSAGRVRDRQSASRLVGRYRHARLDHATPRSRSNTEFRDDRFTAAFERKSGRRRRCSPSLMSCARWRPANTCVRRPSVEDMYRPDRFGRTATESVEVTRRNERERDIPLIPRKRESKRNHGVPQTGSHSRRSTVFASAGDSFAGCLSRLPLGVAARGGSLRSVRRRSAKKSSSRPACVDRDGRLLRAYATGEGRWRLAGDASPMSIRASSTCCSPMRTSDSAPITASIRSRFSARRCSSSASGRIHSGGSTLTMQVARLLEPRSGRNLAAKLRQIVRALEIERALSKDEILSLYLDLAPYGGNIEGIRAASLAYFGKEPRRLTLGEAALLVALPQSPEARRPDRSLARQRAARETACSTASPRRTACRPTRSRSPRPNRCRRPPADADAGAACGRSGGRRSCRRAAKFGSRIDADLQKNLEELARERVRTLALTLGPDISLAMLVGRQRHRRGAGAHVGSPDYFDQRRAGQVDHDAGAALARLDAKTLHLRARLRGRLHSSRDADRGSADALRRPTRRRISISPSRAR